MSLLKDKELYNFLKEEGYIKNFKNFRKLNQIIKQQSKIM